MEGLMRILLGISVILSTTDASLTIKPDKSVLIVLEGDKLEIKCIHTFQRDAAPQGVLLLKNDVSVTLTLSLVIKEDLQEDTYTYSQQSASVNDAATYTCKLEGTGTTSTIRVHVYKSPPFDDLVLKKGVPLNLSCALQTMGGPEDPYVVSWSHNGSAVVVEDRYRLVDNVLQITQPSFPAIDSHDENKDLGEGHDLELKCKVSGYPFPDVTWYKDSHELSDFTAERLRILPYGGSDSGKLKIYGVVSEDKGTYECVASNTISGTERTASAVMKVKVRGKYAALWPAIGIIIELIILFLIIWFSSKRRRRHSTDDDNDGYQPGEVRDDTDSTENLRHRNT